MRFGFGRFRHRGRNAHDMQRRLLELTPFEARRRWRCTLDWLWRSSPRRDGGSAEASQTKILRFLPLLHKRAPATAIFFQWKMVQKKMCGSTVRASGRWTNFKVRFFHSNPRRPLEPFTASITPAICTAHALPFDSHMWTDRQSLQWWLRGCSDCC